MDHSRQWHTNLSSCSISDQQPFNWYDPPLKKSVKKINELQVTATYCFDKENLSDPDLESVEF